MINVSNLSKEFKIYQKRPGLLGSIQSLFNRKFEIKKALNNVSLQVPKGEILGLIGPNGSGKTTLVKILSGIILPTSGTVSAIGHNPWGASNDFKKRISLIMGQKASLWWDLPAHDCFLLLKQIYEINDYDFKQRLDELATHLNVNHVLNIQIRRLSLGERMKVELVAALLHRPEIIFLDEPTIGLDLSSQTALRDFLLDYQKKYRPCMILTSHYMEDIEKLCKRIVILNRGQIIFDGDFNNVVSQYAKHKHIKITYDSSSSSSSSPLSLSEELGKIINHTDQEILIQSPRNQSTECLRYLFNKINIHDLSIVEQDIGSIIENVLKDNTKGNLL